MITCKYLGGSLNRNILIISLIGIKRLFDELRIYRRDIKGLQEEVGYTLRTLREGGLLQLIQNEP